MCWNKWPRYILLVLQIQIIMIQIYSVLIIALSHPYLAGHWWKKFEKNIYPSCTEYMYKRFQTTIYRCRIFIHWEYNGRTLQK